MSNNLIPINSNNYSLLDQFVNMKCEVSFHSLLDNVLSATFIYNSFSYQLIDNCITLLDQKDNDCTTSILLDEIILVKNLGGEVYDDVVSLKTTDYIINVCTTETKFIYPRCFKCGKEILVPEETIWYIKGNANYGSFYDDIVENIIVNSLNFCDDCISNFVGEVGEYNG